MKPLDPRIPGPLIEEPPADQFCDVVINGGIASGVAYPWALLKLARHYRFKNIGGNSVGAMAAALAAAAEYGRCHGAENAFEPLRRLPAILAEEEHGQTKLLRLFQHPRTLDRPFRAFIAAVRTPRDEKPPSGGARLAALLTIYGACPPLLVSLALAGMAAWLASGWPGLAILLLGGVVAAVLALLAVGLRLYADLRRIAANNYGLCKGNSQAPGEEGLVEWLHKGIQLSAGRGRDDPPLTFADLWAAPRFGKPGPAPLTGGLQPPDTGINLQMFSSNVTQGRPVRLPLNDPNTRLFYDPDEWASYFPQYLMTALDKASLPYSPDSASDPEPSSGNTAQRELKSRLRELPSGGMPIVVAARMSLCFPLLFSCVPVYAIDYERRRGRRRLTRCLLSDGGLCTNFPVHLFDAAHPRWPTFALLLASRLPGYANQAIWLPENHLQGRGDTWQRDVPGAEYPCDGERGLAARVLGLAGGMLGTILGWNDSVASHLPQVRNRVIRLLLRRGEGQLNLDMNSTVIMDMAHEYGTLAGKKLVDAYAPPGPGRVSRAWSEHLYVRSMIELRALRRHLRGYSQAVNSRGGQALDELLNEATQRRPLDEDKTRPDPSGDTLSPAQRDALLRAVQAVQTLEAELSACEAQFGPYQPVVEPELRLRSPL